MALENLDGAPGTAPDNLGGSCESGWKTPRRRCDEQSSKSYLSKKQMFNRSVGERSDY
jgi:hypothetical protein